MRNIKRLLSAAVLFSLCVPLAAFAADRPETKTILRPGVFNPVTKYPYSYAVKDWSIQVQFKTATAADAFWIVFSPIEDQVVGQAWGYRSPEELHAMVKMLQEAKANSKTIIYYYLDAGHDFLLINMAEPAFVDP